MRLTGAARDGRFAILPLFGFALLGLALSLRTSVKGAGDEVGQAILAGVAAVYIAVAFALGRLTWRSPLLFGMMLAIHAATALVFGLALSVGDADHHDLLSAWQSGLWGFTPAPLLIAAFTVVCGGMIAPHLSGRAKRRSNAALSS